MILRFRPFRPDDVRRLLCVDDDVDKRRFPKVVVVVRFFVVEGFLKKLKFNDGNFILMAQNIRIKLKNFGNNNSSLSHILDYSINGKKGGVLPLLKTLHRNTRVLVQ